MLNTVMVVILLGFLSAPTVLNADEADEFVEFEEVGLNEGWDLDIYAKDERGVNILTARTVPRGELLFVLMHRARQEFTKDPLKDYFGLDAGGLKVGVGLRCGILNELDVGFLRLNGTAELFDTYEFDLRYRFLNQESHSVDMAIRSGVSWFRQSDVDDAAGFFGQFLLTRSLGHRLTLGTGMLYHSDSSSDEKSTADDDASVAASGLLEVRIMPWLAWDVEMAANLLGYSEDRPAFSTAVKLFTYGHTFSIVLSNTQYVGADGMVTNAWREWDELIIGFGLTRQIEL